MPDNTSQLGGCPSLRFLKGGAFAPVSLSVCAVEDRERHVRDLTRGSNYCWPRPDRMAQTADI